jgi:hypothetical protein
MYKDNKKLLKQVCDNPNVGVEDGKIFLKSTDGMNFQTSTDLQVGHYKLND